MFLLHREKWRTPMDLTCVFTGFRASTEAVVEKKRVRGGWQSRGSGKQMKGLEPCWEWAGE